MTDAELIDKILLLRNTDRLYTDKHGFVNVKRQIMDEINMIRKHDYENHEVLQKWKQDIRMDERTKTLEAIPTVEQLINSRKFRTHCKSWTVGDVLDELIELDKKYRSEAVKQELGDENSKWNTRTPSKVERLERKIERGAEIAAQKLVDTAYYMVENGCNYNRMEEIEGFKQTIISAIKQELQSDE